MQESEIIVRNVYKFSFQIHQLLRFCNIYFFSLTFLYTYTHMHTSVKPFENKLQLSAVLQHYCALILMIFIRFFKNSECLEKEMATHSSILAWRIPGTEEPGRLLLMESHRIGQDWSDLAAAAAWILTYEYSNIFMYMFMYSWNQYNILNQLYYNKSFKKGKRNSECHQGSCIPFGYYDSLVNFSLRQSLYFYLLSMTLAFLKSLGHCLIEYPTIWICKLFPLISFRFNFFNKKTLGDVVCFLLHHWLSSDGWCWLWSLLEGGSFYFL